MYIRVVSSFILISYDIQDTITLLLHTTINIKCFLHLLLLQTGVSFISLLDNRSRLSGYNSIYYIDEFTRVLARLDHAESIDCSM